MKRKLSVLKRFLTTEKVFKGKRSRDRILIIGFILFCTFAFFLGRRLHPGAGKYQLVDAFYITGLRPDGKGEVVYYFFIYDNQETRFNNVDLIVAVDTRGKIFMVREVNEEGNFPMRKSLPADFPPDKIPEIIQKIPKLPKEKKFPLLPTKSPGSSPRSLFLSQGLLWPSIDKSHQI